MKHIWSILCERTSVDERTRNITLFSILEKVTFAPSRAEFDEAISKKALVPFPFLVVTLWSREDIKKSSRFSLVIEIYDPVGEKITTHQRPVEIPEGYKRMRTITDMKGLELGKSGKSGTYLIKVKQAISPDKVETVAELPLEVVINVT